MQADGEASNISGAERVEAVVGGSGATKPIEVLESTIVTPSPITETSGETSSLNQATEQFGLPTLDVGFTLFAAIPPRLLTTTTRPSSMSDRLKASEALGGIRKSDSTPEFSLPHLLMQSMSEFHQDRDGDGVDVSVKAPRSAPACSFHSGFFDGTVEVPSSAPSDNNPSSSVPPSRPPRVASLLINPSDTPLSDSLPSAGTPASDTSMPGPPPLALINGTATETHDAASSPSMYISTNEPSVSSPHEFAELEHRPAGERRGSFWSGFKRSVTSNFSKLRSPKDMADSEDGNSSVAESIASPIHEVLATKSEPPKPIISQETPESPSGATSSELDTPPALSDTSSTTALPASVPISKSLSADGEVRPRSSSIVSAPYAGMIPPPSSLDLATGDLSELIRKHKLEQANVIKSIARRTSLLTQPSGATLGVESSKLTRSLSSAERPTPDVMDASSSSPQRMTSLSDEEIAGKTKPRLLAIEQLKRAARSEHSDGSKTGNVAAKDESLRHVQSDSDEDLDSKATSSSLSTAGKSYKEMDPGVVGKLVFEDAVPDIPPELASEIIGKPDPYHQAVLHNYMECFNFANTEIDEAFRQFALRLYIAGESQVITRIMTAFASRYWDCNPQFHDLYPTMDYIDVIVMGMMVVNTDYHRANVGAKTGNRMTKKLWVGSMMSSLNELVAKEPKNEGLGDKAIRAWQKRLEDVLKKIFDKIVKVPLPQRDLTSRSLDLSSTHSDASGTASPASPRGTRIGLRRDESSLSLASTLSTGTMFSIFDTKRRGTFGSLGFRRKMERTDSRSYLASMARPDDNGSGHHPLALSLDSQLHIAAGSGSPSLGRHSVGGSLTQPRSSTSSWGGTNSASLSRTPSTAEPYLEGELIRKHLKEKDDTKAKNRRWVKFLCRMELSNATSSDGTLELFMYKFEKRADQDATGFQEDEQHGQHGHRTDEVASNKMGRVSSETARTARTFRQIANAPPQTFNLLHALAFPLPPPGYNSYRPHVFTLRLLDGSTYLFHCRDKETVQDWVCTINLWAARKSKEPFLGSGGNSEFGWGPVLEVQRMREMRATGSHSPGPGNLEPSPQDSSPDTLGPAANSTYAASMRSFASTGSEESGRSVATVPSGFVPGTSQRRMTPVSKGDKEFDRKLRRLKIVEWVPPVPAGRVMSTQPEEAQVLVWSRQQENVGKELEEHSYYRDPIEKLYVAYPSLRQKASTNWMRKNNWLTNEYRKYSTYVEVLRKFVDRRKSPPVVSPSPSSVMPEKPAESPPAAPAPEPRPNPTRRRSGSLGSRPEKRNSGALKDASNDSASASVESRGKAGSLDIIREVGAENLGVVETGETRFQSRARRHSIGRLLDISVPSIAVGDLAVAGSPISLASSSANPPAAAVSDCDSPAHGPVTSIPSPSHDHPVYPATDGPLENPPSGDTPNAIDETSSVRSEDSFKSAQSTLTKSIPNQESQASTMPTIESE